MNSSGLRGCELYALSTSLSQDLEVNGVDQSKTSSTGVSHLSGEFVLSDVLEALHELRMSIISSVAR